MNNRMTVNKALDAVAESADGLYAELLNHGTLEIGYYKPDKIDSQEPHEQDEVYVVQTGNGFFVLGDQRQPFKAGDALFVPAGIVHRFEDFSEDFAAWVIFYGPQGGEAA